MSKKPIYVNFMWHMHQPFYKNPVTDVYELPWVRFHGIKDYYDMVAILEEFPTIHQTFNLVPSLVEQILDYTKKGCKDKFLLLSAKPAATLTSDDKFDVLKYFFMANYDSMIIPFARYRELLDKRGWVVSDDALHRVRFTEQEFLDLQVWFNLVWFDPIFRKKGTIVARLMEKHAYFTEEEKQQLLEYQREIMKMIIPEYKKLSTKKQVELTTTPYYHPIMPLVYDTTIARVGMPGVNLPARRFSHPEDVIEQVERAVRFHEKHFGKKPKGMWPSEGSVSEDILPVLRNAGIEWIATDADILWESWRLSRGETNPLAGALYRGYSVDVKGSSPLSIVFRDHLLSDLIGFVYSSWDPVDAANNFISRLHDIRNHLPVSHENFMVSAILDGENAWEYYRNDGRDFLCALYERIEKDPLIKAVTVSEFLKMNKQSPSLKRLFPGSWINHNFGIWIGHSEDNKAWDLLHNTRDTLVEYEAGNPDDEKLAMAWNEIYMAEGSDWNWWYGDDHSSGMDELFDKLYLTHLQNVYTIIGKEIPPELYRSILTGEKTCKANIMPVDYVRPVIDGRVTHYFEWLPAGMYDLAAFGDSMHQVTKIISAFYFGLDENMFYFRVDSVESLIPTDGTKTITLHFVSPITVRVRIDIKSSAAVSAYYLVKDKKDKWKVQGELKDVAVDEIVEIAVPRSILSAPVENDNRLENLELYLSISQGGVELEKSPKNGILHLSVPKSGIDEHMWYV